MKKSKSKFSLEGSGFRRLRVKLGFTQEGLAQRVGVTTHTIWRLENDPVFSPRLETLQAMAKALGVDAAYFLSSAVKEANGILWEPIGVCQRGRVFRANRIRDTIR